MAAAKEYRKAPAMIAKDVVEHLAESKALEMAEAVNPGFINLKVSGDFLAQYLQNMKTAENLGVEKAKKSKKMVLDYGGPNVAKPLHVGHLRSAIIGGEHQEWEDFWDMRSLEMCIWETGDYRWV